jgi:hypothetical protein
MCCVALFAIATTWVFRAVVLLFARLGVAVVMAATAFSAAIFVAEHVDHYRDRALANNTTLLSELIHQPIGTTTPDPLQKIASALDPQTAHP